MQMAEVKSQVAMSADQMIEIIEERKQHVFYAVDEHAQKSLESLLQKKNEVENQLGIIDSAIARTEALLKQSFSTDVLGFNETFDTILKEKGSQGNRASTECIKIPRFSFNKPEKLINVLNSEGIGNVKTVVSTTKSQQSGPKGKESNKVIAGNNLQMIVTVLLRLRDKPGASDLCYRLDKKVSLLECLTGRGGWQ